MSIKLTDRFKGAPQFIVFENPADPEDYVTVQLSIRIDDEDMADLERLIEANGKGLCVDEWRGRWTRPVMQGDGHPRRIRAKYGDK